jgi:hypothetical protein
MLACWCTSFGKRSSRRSWTGQVPLFSGDLDEVVEQRKRLLKQSVQRVDAERLLTVDTDGWAAELAATYRAESVVLLVDGMTYEEGPEVHLDLRHERDRAVRDASKPAWVPAYSMTLCVPFTGDEDLLELRGNPAWQFPPAACIADGELRRVAVSAQDREPISRPWPTRLSATSTGRSGARPGCVLFTFPGTR